MSDGFADLIQGIAANMTAVLKWAEAYELAELENPAGEPTLFDEAVFRLVDAVDRRLTGGRGGGVGRR